MLQGLCLWASSVFMRNHLSDLDGPHFIGLQVNTVKNFWNGNWT